MTQETPSAQALRLLGDALGAMNKAIEITTKRGPHIGMEYIADYLNNTDGTDERVAAITPDDWLTRWQVTRAQGS